MNLWVPHKASPEQKPIPMAPILSPVQLSQPLFDLVTKYDPGITFIHKLTPTSTTIEFNNAIVSLGNKITHLFQTDSDGKDQESLSQFRVEFFDNIID